MSFKKKPKRPYREPPRLASITIRTTAKNKEWLKDCSNYHKCSLSEFIRSHLPKEREQ